MKRTSMIPVLFVIGGFGCVSYTGVSRAEGKLYISGDTSYFFYSAPFIKRCDEEGTALKCEELTELKQPSGAATTTTTAADTSSSAATPGTSTAPATSASAKPPK
jgi:hypothetical protein